MLVLSQKCFFHFTGTTTEDSCCETLTISSEGGTAKHQSARFGTYKRDGEHNGKPVYKQQGRSKILFFSDKDEWVNGASFTSGGGFRSKAGPSASPACPSDVTLWEYYVPGSPNTWEKDFVAKVDCEEGNNKILILNFE